jgi:hypothetical protein
MKRISLLSISMLLISYVSASGDNYPAIPLDYRLHWSPYTQSLISGGYRYKPYGLKYESTGIVSKSLRYSPYVLKYGSSGLVCDNEQYTPYAYKYGSNGLEPYYTYYSPYMFSYNNPGLITYYSNFTCTSGYGCSNMNVITNCTPECTFQESYTLESYYENTEKIYKKEYEARKEALKERRAQIEKNEKEKAEDPSEAIRQVLKDKNIQFSISNCLQMNGKTISASFFIEDANIIIKFWNSKEIIAIVKNSDYEKRVYENYLKSWEDYCLKYIGNSKKIYNIISGNREELYKQLTQTGDPQSDGLLYAKLENSQP